MKNQSYFISSLEMSDVCDTTTNLCINCVGAVDDSIDFCSRGTRRDYYLIYVINGNMHICFDNTETDLNPGSLLIMRPGTQYLYSAQKGNGINYLWIHFSGKCAEETVESFSLPLNSVCSCGQIGNITDYWKKLFREFIIKDQHFPQISCALFTEILAYFSRRLDNSKSKNILTKSIFYIHENYQKNLKISQLAAMENLSESYYRSLFTKTIGESPVEYITSRRIDAAIDLLENTDKTLNEISSLVGYNDVYYFGRKFKLKTGASPGKYRKHKKSYLL